jgi:outer membrane immunogenic protein
MKRILLAGATLLALATAQPALAADAPVYKGPAPVAVALFNWTGLYIGIEGGGGWANTQWTRPSTAQSTGNFTGSGGLIGGTLGYNWQAGTMLFGFEGDISWANINATTNIATCLSCSTNMNWLGTLRARLGWLLAPQALLFASGGLAVGGFQHTLTSIPGFSDTETVAGWTVGGGIEFLLGANWTVKAEYLYVAFASQTACPATSVCGAGTVINNDYFRTSIVRAGLNYKF